LPTGSSIRFPCPQCGKKLAAKPRLAGRQLPCPSCKSAVTVPDEPAEAAASKQGGGAPPESNEADASAEPANEPVAGFVESAPPRRIATVHKGTFTQLVPAAQQTGLIVNTEAIIAARDRDFAAGQYQKAFDVVETVYAQVSAQAARRQSELRQEETRYRSGALKFTPREWLLRQSRATEQTQRIEKFRLQLVRVLDGLTVLRAEKEAQDQAGDLTGGAAESTEGN
jgi:hypothetical protein